MPRRLRTVHALAHSCLRAGRLHSLLACFSPNLGDRSMQLTDILAKMGGLQSVSKEVGVTEAEAATGANALLPVILGGFKKQAQADTGSAGGLDGLLSQLGGGSLLDNVLSPEPTDVSQGNDVLGQIFGSKDVSRTVAQNAAGRTGLDPALLKKMLPMLAMLVAGFMSRGRGGGMPGSAGGGLGGLGGMLGGMLGGGGGGPAMGGRGRAGGLGGLLDLDGDGNALDDILDMAGKMMRR